MGGEAQRPVKLYGIVTSKQLKFGEMLRRLVRFLETVTAAEMEDVIRNLAEFKEPQG